MDSSDDQRRFDSKCGQVTYAGFAAAWVAGGLPPLPTWERLAEAEQEKWALCGLAVFRFFCEEIAKDARAHGRG